MAGIDDNYWLEFAKDNVSKSRESRQKAADRLDSFLAWIWTIYTGIFALASAFNYVSLDLAQLVCVSQPVIVIMLARFSCLMVSMPGESKADPNIVNEIIELHKKIVEDQRKKLIRASILTIISMVSLCIALIGYNYFDPDISLKKKLHYGKLTKEVHEQVISPDPAVQHMNDSLKAVYDQYDLILKTRVLKAQIDSLALPRIRQ